MTVRCDACGTENRDKAMFCRGCAGKLPAFVPTRKPGDGPSDASHPAVRASGTSVPSVATNATSPATTDRSRFGLANPRTLVVVILIAMLGAAVAWFASTATDTERPAAAATPSTTPAIAERLPPEASLSTGEALADDHASDTTVVSPALASSAPGMVNPATPNGVPGAGPLPEIPPTGTEPAPPARRTGRHSTQVAPGGSRASDPRTGCEHLFFAFAARCEANHCQLPAYARHPRCDVVREQRRRDDARRNSMPTS
jgi:hypothetical protein